MAGTVDETMHGLAKKSRIQRSNNLRHMAEQSISARAAFSLTWRIDLLITFEAFVACRSRTFLAIALVDLCIRVTELDRNVSLELIFESDSLNSGNGLDNSALPVCDMTNSTNVNCRLSSDDLWS